MKTAIMAFPDKMIADPFAVSSWAKQILGVGGRHLTPFTLRLCFRVFSKPFLPLCRCMCVCSIVSNSLWPHGLWLARLLSVHGIFQARILEWVAISFSRGSSQPRDQTWVSLSPVLAGEFFTTEPPGKPRPFIANVNSAQHLDFCFWLLCALPALQYSFYSQPR